MNDVEELRAEIRRNEEIMWQQIDEENVLKKNLINVQKSIARRRDACGRAASALESGDLVEIMASLKALKGNK